MMPGEQPVSGAPDYPAQYPVSGGGYAQQGYPQGYPPPGYPQQPGYPPRPYAYPVVRPTNTMAIMSIVFAFVFFPLGIIFGNIAKKQIAQTGEEGETLAKVGVIVGWVHLGFYVVIFGFMICWFLFIASMFAGAAASIPVVTPS